MSFAAKFASAAKAVRYVKGMWFFISYVEVRTFKLNKSKSLRIPDYWLFIDGSLENKTILFTSHVIICKKHTRPQQNMERLLIIFDHVPDPVSTAEL